MSFARRCRDLRRGRDLQAMSYRVISGVVRVFQLLARWTPPDQRLPHGRARCSASRPTSCIYASAEAVVPTKVGRLSLGRACSAPESSPPNFVGELLNLTVLGIAAHPGPSPLSRPQERARAALPSFSPGDERWCSGAAAPGVDLAMPRHDIADDLGLTLRDRLAHVRRAQGEGCDQARRCAPRASARHRAACRH